MKDTYTKELGAFDFNDTIDGRAPILYTKTEESPFHVGMSYVDNPVPMFRCASCGGTEFNVGSEEYFTAIRCPRCGWEACVHEG